MNEQELNHVRRVNMKKLTEAGMQSYPNDFRPSDEDRHRRAELVRLVNDLECKSRLPQEEYLLGDEPNYPLYGRVIAKRGPFLVIQTPHGPAQAYIPNRGSNLTIVEQIQIESLDLADHVAVEGPLMGTRAGDAAIKVMRYRHVSKAQYPPPGKFHGLKDVEKRYRERYVDLFSNPDVACVFRARSTIVKAMREFFDQRGFMEVETPILQSMRGGATAKPFATHHNALDLSLYLRIAPELYLKRLLVGGFDRVYEIGRNFRNEGISTRHNPEFTMCEFYAAYATFEEQIELNEELIRYVDSRVCEEFGDTWKEARSFDLVDPFVKVTIVESIIERIARSNESNFTPSAFDEKLNKDILADEMKLLTVFEEILPKLNKTEAKILSCAQSHGERIYALFEFLVETDLEKMYRTEDGSRSRPVFVTHFPFEVSPLARRNKQDPAFTDRFELYVEGRELSNAFSELNDPDEQTVRFRAQLELRKRGGEETMDFDEDYVRALMHGMPPAAGCGIGIDRLVMLLCNQSSIRDVLFFPLMRPES